MMQFQKDIGKAVIAAFLVLTTYIFGLAQDYGQTAIDAEGNAISTVTSLAATQPPPQHRIDVDSGYTIPVHRNPDDWELIHSEELSVPIPESDRLAFSFDPETEVLSVLYPELPMLTSTQEEAVERAPAWLRADLADNLRRFDWSIVADWFAEQIINAPDPYVDEVAFQVAHIAPGLLSSVIYLELLLENAQWIYTIDSTLQYVEIVDYGSSIDDDYWTTTRYRMIEESGDTVEVEIDRDYYYWFIVHPKLSDELPTYIDPATGDPADPPVGVFWRTWLWNHADSSYTPYCDYWDDCEFLWDRTNIITDAIDVANQWVSDVMEWGVHPDRPIQPVRIYVVHMGFCGEHQDIRGAAGRIALIPANNTSNICEDHVWNEFWDGTEWIHWDGGTINNPLLYENGWGKTLSGVFTWRGDGYIWNVSDRYSAEVCTLQVTIYDSVGKPADGHVIRVYSEGWLGGFTYASWGITNSLGEVSFQLGDDQNYYVRVDGPLGSYPITPGSHATVIQGSIPGQTYYWEHSLDGQTPTLEISEAPDPPNPLEVYRMEIDYEVDYETAYGNYFTYNLMIPIVFSEKMSTGVVDFFILDEANFNAYEANEPLEGFEIGRNVQSGLVDYIIPDEEPWYAVMSSLERSVNRPMVHALVNVYRAATPVVEHPETGELPTAYALQVPHPNPFNSETVITFALPEPASVDVSVYNLMGRQVAKLVDLTLQAGYHQVRWNGRNEMGSSISSGVYLVKMTTGAYQSLRKVCYLR
jgi:hypothetical protein